MNEQELDIHHVIGAIDAARVVDGGGIDPAAAARKFDARELRESEIAAFAHYAATEFDRIHAQRIVTAVANISMAFAARLHEGADAAVPQLIHRRAQYRLYHLAGHELFRLHAERAACLGALGDGLRAPRIDAAAGRDQRGVVIGPIGTRQGE